MSDHLNDINWFVLNIYCSYLLMMPFHFGSDRSIAIYDLRMSSPARKLIMQVLLHLLTIIIVNSFFTIFPSRKLHFQCIKTLNLDSDHLLQSVNWWYICWFVHMLYMWCLILKILVLIINQEFEVIIPVVQSSSMFLYGSLLLHFHC